MKNENVSLPPVAKSPKDCVVGPTIKERASNEPWRPFSSSNISSRKRQRDDSSSSATATTTTTTSSDDDDSESTSFDKAIGTFLSSGCCVIPDVLPKEFVNASLEKSNKDLQFLETCLFNLRQKAIQEQNTNLLAQVGRGDFREFVDRDGCRRDVRFQLDKFPFTAEGLIYNPIVFPLVKSLLGGDDVCLLYAGVMWAKPANENCDEPQKWHGDGGHLFSHTHLPPHCINVFYPLVDLSNENGCTEFVPGSHRLGNFNSGDDNNFGLCCKAGGAVLFDYRLKHRGGSNVSQEPRPVLYLAYSKPFFWDTGNTRSERSLLDDSMMLSVSSPPWVSRILKGEAVSMGYGFENIDATTLIEDKDTQDRPSKNIPTTSASSVGSGERWVLFRMNIEILDCKDAVASPNTDTLLCKEPVSAFRAAKWSATAPPPLIFIAPSTVYVEPSQTNLSPKLNLLELSM